MALRICSTNIMILVIVLTFIDISLSRSIEPIGREYLGLADNSESQKRYQHMSEPLNRYENHVKMLKQVNGYKHHNIFHKHKDVGPLVYIINPLEAKVPKAYLTMNEFKQAIIDRVIRLKSQTRQNTIFWYTGKVAPTRTPFIGRNGRIEIEHNWKRKPDLKNIRPIVENKFILLKSKIENDSRTIGHFNRELKKRDNTKSRKTAATKSKLNLRQRSKSHKIIPKPNFRSKGIRSALKSRNSSKSDIKINNVRSSAALQTITITSTTMPTKINHPAIRISHASIHGTEDEINPKDNVKISGTDVEQIQGYEKMTSSKTIANVNNIKQSSGTIPSLELSNTKSPIKDSSSIASKGELLSKTPTEAGELKTEIDYSTIVTSDIYYNTALNKTKESSLTVTITEKSSTANNNAGEYSAVVSENKNPGTVINETEKYSTTITELEESSTAITETEKSSTGIPEVEESTDDAEKFSTVVTEVTESITAANNAGEFSTTETESSIVPNNAEESTGITDTNDMTNAEELVPTELETSATEMEETTTIATEAPITKSRWRPHTLSRPLVFMGKGFSKK